MTRIPLGPTTTRWIPLLLAGLTILLGAIVVLAATGSATVAEDRTLITTASASPEVPFEKFDGNPPKLYDIDKDGDQEIIAQNDNDWIYVFDSKSGEILFETKTPLPPFWGARSLNGPEVAILEHDGNVHLVVANSAAVVTTYKYEPAASNETGFSFTKVWERRMDGCFDNPAMDAKPVLVDLDGDEDLEILAATEEHGLYALQHTGRLLWKNCLGGGNAAPRVTDLDQNGAPDIVHVSDTGVVAALYGSTGDWRWGFNIRDHFDIGAASIPVSAGIGQLDGEGGPDIVVGARDSHAPENWTANNALLLALSSDGHVLWSNQDPQGNPLTYTRPIVVDAGEDGENEVYWGDWNTIGHKPPPPDSEDAWQRTGPAHFYRYSASGELVWRQTLDTYWSNKDLAIADVTGDGVQDVLANGPGDEGDGIWYLDTRTGAKQQFVSTHPWKVTRGPIAGDVWGNGTTQWVVPVQAATNAVSGGGVLVQDTGVPYDAAWPHLPDPDEPAPPPEPNGTFNATFRIHNPNPWWQEVTIDPHTPRELTQVHVQIDGGTWREMSKSHWGPWTASHNAPEGSQVAFRATDATGAASISQPFTWLDGTHERENRDPDADPAPPEDPPDLVASFDPVSGNEWWVEVAVDADAPLSTVEARVDQGDWIGLEETDWGTWAASFQVGDNATVRFRATSADGATNTSSAYRWPSGDPITDDPGPEPEPDPEPDPEEPSNLTASFTPSTNANEWWVEVRVDAGRELDGVAAKVEDGDWTPLDRTSWGTWARSFHVPDGATVTFQATATDGATATSQAYRWPSGEPVSDGTPPPPSEEFTASFDPTDGVNSWWVEAGVDASQPPATVDASVDGGSWHALTLQDWGTWAASFHVPEGSEVTFRATNATGATDTSDAFLWPDGVPAEPDTS